MAFSSSIPAGRLEEISRGWRGGGNDRAAAGEAGIGKSRARPRRSETHWRRGQARRRALAAPQLSADFVAEVGDQKGDAAEAISSSRPLPSARLGAAALTQWH